VNLSYTALKQTIQDYVQNSEPTFVSNIPTFVQLAEERVYNSVQLPAIRKNQTGTLTLGNKYLTLPTDWLATFSLTVIDPVTQAQTFLLDKDVNFVRQAYPLPTSTGTPAYYAQFDVNTLILGPTPDAAYAVELHYYYYPESIVTAGTSWLGSNFAEVLLYGALREAYLFMKGEADVIQNYEQKYQEGMILLKQLGDGKNRQDAYRNGQVRVPVQ
jgi:hypothetical protein